jgi:HAD superfamily hydrolase (TIGR01509 family)
VAAFVFDCDGVLVDSEPLAVRAWGSLTERHGYRITAEDMAACVGRTELATWEYLATRVPLPPFTESLAAVDEVRWKLYDEELRAFPDAVAAVQDLALHGHRLAVASSSRIAELEDKLQRVGLTRYFEAVAGGDEVDDGKPSPDVFLLAAERLGVAPSSCLAIEDSDPGAEAAEAAGMRVIVVNRHGAVHPVHATVSSLDAETLALIGQ